MSELPLPKILICDDCEHTVMMTAELISDQYTLETAFNGQEAIDKFTHFNPDLLLLDVSMPKKSGLEVCEHIRSSYADTNTKILLISACIGLDERLRGYKAGADDYITKPFNPEELLAKIGVFCRLKQAEDQLQTMNADLEETVRLRSQQLSQSEELSMLGRHAAGVVHNLNNPLAGVLGYAHLLSELYPDCVYTKNLVKASEEMKNIVASLLCSVQKTPAVQETRVDLNDVLRQCIELMRIDPFFRGKLTRHMEYGNIPSIRGVRHHFSQVFNNILKNAADAMYYSSRRELFVTTRAHTDCIEIIIEDTGEGISPENQEKLFDPLFTTKPVLADNGEPTGTGLGLASCQEIIKSYNGAIHVSSELGKGSVFTIEIPVSPKPSIRKGRATDRLFRTVSR